MLETGNSLSQNSKISSVLEKYNRLYIRSNRMRSLHVKRKFSFDKQHETLDNEKEDDNFIGTSIFDHLAFNILYL